MKGLARWCFKHRKVVLLVWLLALVGSSTPSRLAGTSFSTKFSLPNTPSATALNLLQKDFPAASGSSDQIVLHATSGTVRDAPLEARAQRMLADIATLPHVRSVVSPYSTQGSGQISNDGTVAFATVNFNEQPQNLSKAAVQRVITSAQAAGDQRLAVAVGGPDVENAERQSPSRSTGLGVVFALIVLGLAFGALFAAVLPLITALIAIGVGYSITGLLTHVFSISSFATILGILIGLGVGVDYALLIVTRHRAGLRGGRSVEESAVNSLNTAGRAVLFAGITVCIALLGQFALGVSFLYGVAVSAAITVALTMLASLTLLPALLGFLGPKVLSRRQRARLRVTGPVAEEVAGFWYRWAKGIERRPVLPAVLALAAVVVIALPIFSLRLGLDDAGSDPAGTTSHQAYELLAEGFGPGFNGPLELVAELPQPADEARFDSLVHALARQPGVVAVTPSIVSPNGTVAIAQVYPSTSPQSVETSALVARLRDDVIPAAEAGTGLRVYVGGSTASQVDFAHVLSSKLFLFVGVVIVLGFLLLMALFRSLLIPLIASVMNLLSVGAALGIMNAIFEWGWGRSLFAISTIAPVEVFVPVIMISILFGLSMDYEVFLVSRMHEEWLLKRDNRSRRHPRPGGDRPGDHRRRRHHDPGLRVVRVRRRHRHQAVRHRAGRRDHHRRLHRPHGVGALAHAPLRQGQLVAPGLARPDRAAAPRGGRRPPGVAGGGAGHGRLVVVVAATYEFGRSSAGAVAVTAARTGAGRRHERSAPAPPGPAHSPLVLLGPSDSAPPTSAKSGVQHLDRRGEVEGARRRRGVVGEGVTDLAVHAVDGLHPLAQHRLLLAEPEEVEADRAVVQRVGGRAAHDLAPLGLAGVGRLALPQLHVGEVRGGHLHVEADGVLPASARTGSPGRPGSGWRSRRGRGPTAGRWRRTRPLPAGRRARSRTRAGGRARGCRCRR